MRESFQQGAPYVKSLVFSTDLINVLSGAMFLYPMKMRNMSFCTVEWRI